MRTAFIFILTFFFMENLVCQKLSPFRQAEKWFFVDGSFRPVSTKTYSFLFPFKGQRAIVRQGNKYGVIDDKENIIIPCTHDTIAYVNTFFYCLDKGIETYLDKNGNPFKVPGGICGGAYGFGSSFQTYSKDNRIGLLIYNNNESKYDSLPNLYSELHEFNSNVGFAKLGKKWGVINSKGKIITNFTLDSIQVNDSFERTSFILHKYFLLNAIGFINVKGKIVTPAKYKESFFNLDTFTLIKSADDQLGYIDYLGHEYFK